MNLSQKCKDLVGKSENDPNVMFEVGISLIEGKNDFKVRTAIKKGNIDLIPEDLEKAEKILNKCSMNENSEVPLLFGLIMLKREEFKKAAEYFKISSKAGNGEGQYELAKLLYEGKGIKKNTEEAIKLFRMSKKDGINKCDQFLKQFDQLEHSIESPENKSLSNQAVRNYNDNKIPKNKMETANYFKMLADKGDSSAMSNYVIMLRGGDGIPMNKTEAAHYFKMAIDKGNDAAMRNYASMLYELK